MDFPLSNRPVRRPNSGRATTVFATPQMVTNRKALLTGASRPPITGTGPNGLRSMPSLLNITSVSCRRSSVKVATYPDSCAKSSKII